MRTCATCKFGYDITSLSDSDVRCAVREAIYTYRACCSGYVRLTDTELGQRTQARFAKMEAIPLAPM